MDTSTPIKQARTEQCQRNARTKSEQKRLAALEALSLLQQERTPVTKAAVARRAGVSVVFLRSHPDLQQAIEEAEQLRLHTPYPSPAERMKDQTIAMLRRRLDELKKTLKKTDAELRRKQREVERVYGKLAAGSVLTDPELRSALASALQRLAAQEELLARMDR